MAVLFVGFLGILVIFILGLIEKLFCAFFPPLKYIKWLIIVFLWPVLIYLVMSPENGYYYCFAEKIIAFFVLSFVYWLFIITIKLLLVPLSMAFDIFEILKTPAQQETVKDGNPVSKNIIHNVSARPEEFVSAMNDDNSFQLKEQFERDRQKCLLKKQMEKGRSLSAADKPKRRLNSTVDLSEIKIPELKRPRYTRGSGQH